MNFVLIPDKFKGSLTGAEVSNAISRGILEAFPTAGITVFPASDGGDGFLEVVQSVREVTKKEVMVEDPLGRDILAPFLVDQIRREAFLEMATASGMVLLKESERNPLKTHTRGTGQLILEALESGARKIYVGLGGSATNDGGCGIAATFGFRFLDASGNSLAPTGENLQKIQRILPPNDLSVLKDVEIIAVNDVSNPLSGPEGAAFVYARQKGASVQEIQLLDDGLRHLDKVVAEQLGIEASDMPGAGAAGGAAYGLHCFLNARFISGTDYVLGINGVDDHLRENPVDYVITGEGRIDDQTLHGKLIQGVLELAVRHEVPVLAVCGISEIPVEDLIEAGFQDVIPISDPTRSLAFNMSQAARLTREAVGRYFLNQQHV